MTLTGICYICSKPAMYSCTYCGRIACIDHYTKDKRACSNCLAKFENNEQDDERSGYNPDEILF